MIWCLIFWTCCLSFIHFLFSFTFWLKFPFIHIHILILFALISNTLLFIFQFLFWSFHDISICLLYNNVYLRKQKKNILFPCALDTCLTLNFNLFRWNNLHEQKRFDIKAGFYWEEIIGKKISNIYFWENLDSFWFSARTNRIERCYGVRMKRKGERNEFNSNDS